MAVSKFSIIFAASMPEITSRASIAGDVLPVRASATLEDFVADENPCPVTLASFGEAIDTTALERDEQKHLGDRCRSEIVKMLETEAAEGC